MSPEVAERRKIEKSIIRRFALDAIKAGFTLGVCDGQEVVIKGATTAKAVLDKMFSVDEEDLLVYDGSRLVGMVNLVYGNGGWDVISDYSPSMEPLMKGVNELVEKNGW